MTKHHLYPEEVKALLIDRALTQLKLKLIAHHNSKNSQKHLLQKCPPELVIDESGLPACGVVATKWRSPKLVIDESGFEVLNSTGRRCSG